MKDQFPTIEPSSGPALTLRVRDRALSRIWAEVHAGLRHGYFSFTLTCDVISHGRRRLVLHAGKNHQFVIPAEECEVVGVSSDLREEGAVKPCS